MNKSKYSRYYAELAKLTEELDQGSVFLSLSDERRIRQSALWRAYLLINGPSAPPDLAVASMKIAKTMGFELSRGSELGVLQGLMVRVDHQSSTHTSCSLDLDGGWLEPLWLQTSEIDQLARSSDTTDQLKAFRLLRPLEREIAALKKTFRAERRILDLGEISVLTSAVKRLHSRIKELSTGDRSSFDAPKVHRAPRPNRSSDRTYYREIPSGAPGLGKRS